MSFNSKSGLISAAALFAVGVGVSTWLHVRSDADVRGNERSSAEEIVDRHEKEISEKALQRLERRLAKLEAKQVRNELSLPPIHSRPNNTQEQPQHPILTEEEVESEHLTRLRNEPVDREHKAELDQRINELIEIPELGGTEVTGIECGSITCRIDISYGNPEEQEIFMATMMQGLGRYNGFSRNVQENGLSKSRLYLTKVTPVEYVDRNGNGYQLDE
jgi:hypothetical protein